MSHPREFLPLIASGYVLDHATRAHIATCDPCSRSLDALTQLDLDYSWAAIAAELDAPKASLLERVLTATGLSPGLSRFAALTPTLRPAWLLATFLVLALGTLAGQVVESSLPFVLLAAPILAAASVAFAYGPGADKAYELTAATPLSPVTGLLVRLALVLAADAILVGAFDVVGGTRTLVWFLPMAGVAALSATIAARTQPLIGAATGMVLWSTAVAAVATIADHPRAVVAGPAIQLACLFALIACVVLLTLWARIGRSPAAAR